MSVWEARYVDGDTPWDSGEPSLELVRILEAHAIRPGRALEVGCGTGVNAVFLASRGFEVTATDVSPTALAAAKKRAAEAAVDVMWVEADLLAAPDLGQGYDLVFDRGVYHVLRRGDAAPFLALLARVLRPGGLYVVLAGNANDAGPADQGPPRVHAHELCAELQPLFDLVELREFTWSGVRIVGREVSPLGWAGVLRRRAAP